MARDRTDGPSSWPRGLRLAGTACAAFPVVHVLVLMHSFVLVGTDVRERRAPDGTRSYEAYVYDGPKTARPSTLTGVPKGRVVRVDSLVDRTVTHYADPVGTWTSWPVPAEAVERQEFLMRFVPLDIVLALLAVGLFKLADLVAPHLLPRSGLRGTSPVPLVPRNRDLP